MKPFDLVSLSVDVFPTLQMQCREQRSAKCRSGRDCWTPAWRTSLEPYVPSIPTQEEESQPPSVPAGVEGTLTLGTRQMPTACAQVPEIVLPAQLFDVNAVSATRFGGVS